MSPADAVGDEAGEPPAEPVDGPPAEQTPGDGDPEPEGVDAGAPVPSEEPDLAEEPRRYPSTIGGLFYLLILTVTATGLVLAYVEDWRLGVRVLGGGLMGASALRLVLPERDAGMLAVRHRLTDVLLLAATGAALFFLAGDIPDQPL